MQPKTPRYLFDIRQACERLLRFTSGKSLHDYNRDDMLRSAVERQFEIVGEALNQMLALEPSLEDRVTASRQIVAFRNRLIHNYWAISNDVVWGILEADVPVLGREVDALLAEAPPLEDKDRV
jgi:uncharacterized protein with HEPN domain